MQRAARAKRGDPGALPRTTRTRGRVRDPTAGQSVAQGRSTRPPKNSLDFPMPFQGLSQAFDLQILEV